MSDFSDAIHSGLNAKFKESFQPYQRLLRETSELNQELSLPLSTLAELKHF